ncbi:MAG: hypothetical protein M1816_003057 [Peltula sp. TS41687]|nr:MAG: hypothetical protein M1816_003057 [Peltula sp. TS41687]
MPWPAYMTLRLPQNLLNLASELGDILRLRCSMPAVQDHLEIEGDVIRPIENPPLPPDRPDNAEDISAALALLPEAEVDRSNHFVEKGKYQNEIDNLPKCPGTPLSAHFVQLHGRSPDGELVFEKLDLYFENLLFSADGERLVVADLRGPLGITLGRPGEITFEDRLNSKTGWSSRTSTGVGICIKCIVYANVPVTGQALMDWRIPPPFEDIVKACLRTNPADCPSLDELSAVVQAIET